MVARVLETRQVWDHRKVGKARLAAGEKRDRRKVYQYVRGVYKRVK